MYTCMDAYIHIYTGTYIYIYRYTSYIQTHQHPHTHTHKRTHSGVVAICQPTSAVLLYSINAQSGMFFFSFTHLYHTHTRTNTHFFTYTKLSAKLVCSLSYTHLLAYTYICNTLPHAATHCHTLQHTATHCNTLQHMSYVLSFTHAYLHTHTHIRKPILFAYGVATMSRLL